MPRYDQLCLWCKVEWEVVSRFDTIDPCPYCGAAPVERIWRSAPTVIDDSIPGGMKIENLGGMTFYSKSEWRAEIKRQGLIHKVQHRPPPDSDKSPLTQRWI